LLALPIVVFVVYPPDVKKGAQAAHWAAQELAKLGSISRSECLLAALVLLAILLWVFASNHLHPTTVALMVIGLMLVLRLLTWDDVASNHESWKALTLMATLVTLAGGLSRTGFVTWFAEGVSHNIGVLSPIAAMAVLLSVYFFSHYMFASITAHVTAMMPIMLAIGTRIPGVPGEKFALLLAFTHGLMGVLTPYATTSGPVYLGSGFITTAEFWRLGIIFGGIFLAALLGLVAPVMLWTG
jgi:L-tartrate/succinate antiporter